MPDWLGRLVTDLDIEGETLMHRLRDHDPAEDRVEPVYVPRHLAPRP